MKKRSSLKALVLLVLVAVAGGAVLYGSARLEEWRSPQHKAYNEALSLYKQGKADEALVAFDKSLDAYRRDQDANRSWLDKLLYPGPSTEVAALAQSKKAILYIMKQKPEQAVNAFKESIRLNPGGDQFLDLAPAEMKLLSEQSLVVKRNLELLFKKNPSMAQGEGKGRPQQGNQPGRPRPGEQPGSQPGKGNNNDI